MKNKFKLLRDTDDNTIDKLSSYYCEISQKEKDRMFAMSERKLEAMKSTAADIDKSSDLSKNECPETVEIENPITWYKSLRTFGVCLAGVIVVIGTAVFSNTVKPNPVPSVTSDTNYVGTIEAAAESSIEESINETTGTISISDEENKNITNSSAETSVNSTADFGITTDKKDEDIQSSLNDEVSAAESETVNLDKHYEELPDNIENYGKTTKQKILDITPDMTYDEAITYLGEPETIMLDGYAQFIVDNSELLMIYYNSKSELIGINGNELLASCKSLSELEADPNNLTFEGYVVFCEGTIRITCPQYSPLGCADLWFSDGFDTSGIKVGDKVRISYYGDVMESYPPIIQVKEISLGYDNI